MEEFGVNVDLVIKSDAVAAIGIVKRQGLGRVRHLAVGDLWVQQKAKNKEAYYQKLPGEKNTADMMTKAVEKELVDRHMQAMGLWYREGRHVETPAYTGREDGVPGVGDDDAQEEGQGDE